MPTDTDTKVTLLSHYRRSQVIAERDLSWYDPATKTMKFFRGSRLEFDYNPTAQQVVPRVVREAVPAYKSSWDEIELIVRQHLHKLAEVVWNPKYSVSFEIDDDYFWYDLEKQLRQKAIRYEVE